MRIPPVTPRFGALFALLGSLIPAAQAELRVPAIFSPNAVLQQGKPIPIWGWSEDGEAISVEFRGKTARTTAVGGRWKVEMPSQRPGLPDSLIIKGTRETITLTNILVGEVWVCSGQSNMEWPLSRSENPQGVIDAARHDEIRLFTVPKLRAEQPADDVRAAWQVCRPDTVPGFSAVAYYFGVALAKSRGVPVGLIHTSWGGSPAEVWIRESVLASMPEFKTDILDSYPQQKRAFEASLAEWEKEAAQLRAQGKQPARGRPWANWRPSELYNGMIYPIVPYAIAGAIWYQGESNAGRADQYSRLFPTLIQNWREDWGQGDFPFLAVQLAPWDKGRQRSLDAITEKPVESDWAELRESQLLATHLLPKVGLAVITDLGDKDDIHPIRKREVGERLALAARGIAYKERITYSGPEFRKMSVSRGKAVLSFDHVGKGLEARGGALKGFQICGGDRVWYWAEASIDGRRVVVSSPKVETPVAVRYGWADFPVVNLYNLDGLPASPFRTDNFPISTARKP
ncbi:MAG: hypothetical protein JNK85_11810 [Verrucomicrobiales bacterium]|nr:hypothetical protein [Verrucomicrobiales bacterium]